MTPTHPILYLASPYSDPREEVRKANVRTATEVAAQLMLKGYSVFSPITHGHQVAAHLPEDHLLSHEFWMSQCLPMVRVCDMLVVLRTGKWGQSRGIQAEWDYATKLKKPRGFLSPNEAPTFSPYNLAYPL